MTSLSQMLGVLSGVKSRTERVYTDAHKASQRPAPLSGIARSYRPNDDADVTYPPESTNVQVRATDLIRDAFNALEEQFAAVAKVDATNCVATADVVLESGTVLAVNVPAVTLLYLEKKFTDIATFVAKLPVLDPSESWLPDSNTGLYRTEPIETFKMKKVMRNHVLSPATDKHPANVQVYTEDVPVGTWTSIKYSGALPGQTVRDLTVRVEQVRKALRFAREQANQATVVDSADAGRGLLSWVFGA
jgi:hypothetical protein